MNPYNELKNLVEEVQGTESEEMKAVIATTARLKAIRAKKKNAKAAAALAKGKK